MKYCTIIQLDIALDFAPTFGKGCRAGNYSFVFVCLQVSDSVRLSLPHGAGVCVCVSTNECVYVNVNVFVCVCVCASVMVLGCWGEVGARACLSCGCGRSPQSMWQLS